MSHSTFTVWSLHGIWVLQTSIWSLWAPVGLVSGMSCARMRTRDFCTDGSSPPLDSDQNLDLRICSKGEIGWGGWEACLGQVLGTTKRGPHWTFGSPWWADWRISGPNASRSDEWCSPVYKEVLSLCTLDVNTEVHPWGPKKLVNCQDGFESLHVESDLDERPVERIQVED